MGFCFLHRGKGVSACPTTNHGKAGGLYSGRVYPTCPCGRRRPLDSREGGNDGGAGIIHSGDPRPTHITWHRYGMPSTAFYCGCRVSIAARDGRKTLR